MRKETLGKSSLVLRSKLPPHMRKVRFNLPDSPVREEAGSDRECEIDNVHETSDGTKRHLKSTDQMLRNRIDGIHGLIKQRKTRPRAGRRRTTSADYTAIWQNKKGLQRARDVRSGNLHSSTVTGAKCKDDDNKRNRSENETSVLCEDCQKIFKERDKFWGLESDSEEEDIKDFNKHVRRRSLRRDSRCFEVTKGNAANDGSYKDWRIAGRGTWATPAYVPPWEAREADRKGLCSNQRDQTMREEGWSGHKKGI